MTDMLALKNTLLPLKWKLVTLAEEVKWVLFSIQIYWLAVNLNSAPFLIIDLDRVFVLLGLH